MIRDMVSVSEATDWSVRSSTESKYRSLRCHIESLKSTHPEYKQTRDHIMDSIEG